MDAYDTVLEEINQQIMAELGDKKPRYTEQKHAQLVRKVIEKESPGNHCPAGRKFEKGPIYDLWEAPRGDEIPEIKKPCFICTEFIGLKHYTPEGEKCPCFRLGTKRAVELTWQALKEKGYL
ncbi:hypothetical protein LCGC14_1381540 [marine sediment metagenome]|uniref:Uncharacterized protein n=1 Tax=marine sediment metagenome TaxID=412755 RepID=A0A0F9KNG6_9ZZZZ